MNREELDFDDLLDRIATLTEELQGLPESDPSRRVFDLLDYLEAYHREAILRLASAVPPEALQAARQDPLVASLLDAYLAEDDEEGGSAIVEEALEEIRPYVHSHGGEIEVAGIDHGVVSVRLMGSCNGCPSSVVTLTQGVERTLRDRWSGFRELKVENVEQRQTGKLLQIERLRRG